MLTVVVLDAGRVAASDKADHHPLPYPRDHCHIVGENQKFLETLNATQ